MHTAPGFSMVIRQLVPNAVLSKSPVLLKTYTGELIPALGEMNVEVKYGSQISILTLTVVEGSGPSLFGRLDFRFYI